MKPQPRIAVRDVAAEHGECWLAGPDGYNTVLASSYGDIGSGKNAISTRS